MRGVAKAHLLSVIWKTLWWEDWLINHRRAFSTLASAFVRFPFAEHAAAQETTVTLVGTVVDSASGMPVAEVTVYIDGRNFTDTTDYAGEFSVGDLLGGTHVVLLMKTGYTHRTAGVRRECGPERAGRRGH